MEKVGNTATAMASSDAVFDDKNTGGVEMDPLFKDGKKVGSGEADPADPAASGESAAAAADTTTATTGGDKIELKQKLSLVNGITVIVGSIIGSGIFVSPKGVLAGTGSVGLALIVWVLSGVYSMIGAYCYAELGTAIVRSGADYAYLFEAFGPFLAFIRLWVECMIVRPCSQAILALTFAYYVMEPLFPDCTQPDDAVRLLAAVCIREYLASPSRSHSLTRGGLGVGGWVVGWLMD